MVDSGYRDDRVEGLPFEGMDEEVVEQVVDVGCWRLLLGEGDGRTVTIDRSDMLGDTAKLASEKPFTTANVQHATAIWRECCDDQRVVVDVVIPSRAGGHQDMIAQTTVSSKEDADLHRACP